MAMAPRAGELVNVSAFLTSLAMAWGYFTTQGGTLLLVDKKSGSPLLQATLAVGTMASTCALPFVATFLYEMALFETEVVTELVSSSEDTCQAPLPNDHLLEGQVCEILDKSPLPPSQALQAPRSTTRQANLTKVAVLGTASACLWCFSSWLALSSMQTNIADQGLKLLDVGAKFGKNYFGFDVVAWGSSKKAALDDLSSAVSMWSGAYLKSTGLGLSAFLVNVLLSKVEDAEDSSKVAGDPTKKKTRFIIRLWNRFDK